MRWPLGPSPSRWGFIGAHVEYLVFEDEGHGFRKRENRITAVEAYVDFLDRFL